jgi:DNA-binding NarL/FixJ family response regulator
VAERLASPVLIGRRAELERLTAALAAAGGGAPVLLVAGDAGVGKTRLISEFTSLAIAGGSTVLVGGCLALGGGGLPYAPFAEALRRLARARPPAELDAVVGDARGELARLVPALSAPGSMPPGPDPGAATNQGLLFEGVLGLLVRLSLEAPVALVLDDLHWADHSTLDLLVFLARNLADSRVLIVGTYRSDDMHRRHPLLPVIVELVRSGRLDRIELRPLEHDDVRLLIASIRGSEPEPGLVTAVAGRSGGNPFYVEELLATRATGSEMPDTLREVLLARIGSLTERTQEVMRLASAAGARFSGPLLEDAAGIDETDVLAALREAVEWHVVHVLGEAGGEATYAFRHALLQEALYGELLAEERRRLHAAYARALQETGRERPDAELAAQLAYHWTEAGNAPEAFAASLEAATLAERVAAFADAHAQYEGAIGLWERVRDATARIGIDRPALLERTARAAWAAGSPSHAIERIRQALELVDPSIDPVRAGLLYEQLGRYCAAGGDHAAALAARHHAVALVPGEPPSAARARAVAGLARSLAQAGRYPESIVRAREALSVARQAGAPDVAPSALNTLGVDEGYLGDAEAGVAHLEEARDAAFGVGDIDEGVRAWCNLVNLFEVCGRASEAASAGLEAAEHAERHGLGRALAAAALCQAAGALYELGRWDEARALLERVRRSNPEGDSALEYHMTFAWLETGRGAHGEAASHLDAARALLRPETREQWKVFIANNQAQLELERGDLAAARSTIAPALEILSGFEPGDLVEALWILPTALRVEADAAATARDRHQPGVVDQAARRGEALLAQVQRAAAAIERDLPALARKPTAAVAVTEAEWTRLDGHSDPERWSEAATCAEAAPHAHVAAYCRFRQAEALLATRRDRVHAASTLRESHRIAMRLGADQLRGEVEALALRARVELDAAEESPPGPPEVPDPFGLTAREREVLVLVAAGRSNRQIGEALFISAKTAGVHVSNILGKLEVSSRTQAAAAAHRLGLD